MPYKIIKSGKGYKVQNIISKKTYSKKPLTKVKAEKQLVILRIAERKEKKRK